MVCSLDINECLTANGGCEHNCTNTVGGHNCSCLPGFELNDNNLNCTSKYAYMATYVHTCMCECVILVSCSVISKGARYVTVFYLDINECTEGTHNCDGNATCTDTDGSFDCVCNTGYTGNGTDCAGKLLLYTYEHTDYTDVLCRN